MRAYLREPIVIPFVLGQTSLSVSIKIMRLSDGYWFDFNDSTFKNSGWVSDVASMSSDDNTVFTYAWTTPDAQDKYQPVFIDNDAVYQSAGEIVEVYGGTVFTVQTDVTNTATTFKTDLPPATDNFYRAPSLVKILKGALIGQTRKLEVVANNPYIGATKFIKLAESLTAEPLDDGSVRCVVINE